MISIFTLIGTAYLYVLGTVSILQGRQLPGVLDMVIGSLGLLNLLIFNRRGRIKPAGSVLLILMACLFLILFVEGGIAGTGHFWLFSYPALAFFLKGKRQGLIWMGGFTLLLAIAFVVYRVRGLPLLYSDLFRIILLLSLCLISALIYIYEEVKSRAQAQLVHKTEQLTSLNARLERLSSYDSLTRIFNRRMILARLDLALKSYQRYGHHFSILLFDLDFFKEVNDTYGHQFGDRVLKQTVECINSRGIRGVDCFGRYGGEEFLIILPETDLAGARTAAERIRSLVAEQQVVHPETEQAVSVTISIGVAATWEGCSLDSLLRHADVALYRAKQEGRNRVEVPQDQDRENG